jgi:hypothetical protein
MKDIRDEHFQIKMLNRCLLIDELLSLGYIGGRKDLVDFLRLTWEIPLPNANVLIEDTHGGNKAIEVKQWFSHAHKN